MAAKADLSNWRTPPHNTWAFQNVDKLLNTETISNGNHQPTKLEKASNPISFDNIQVQKPSSDQTLDWPSLLKYTNTDGIIVLHKGKAIYESYSNGNNAETKHILFSITKSITGLIAGILSSRGQFDLTAPIKHYVPSASHIWDGATVQQCLDMQTGVIFDDNDHVYRAASGWEPLDGSEGANETLHAFLENVEAEVDEQKGFHYSSVNTDLLGWAIENATNRKLSDLTSELLWQPLRASHPAHLTVDSAGSPRAAGGLCATVSDLARLGQLLAEGGHEIVPKSWLEDMLQHGDKVKWKAGAFAPGFSGEMDDAAYRDCWIADERTGTLCALGVFGQLLMVDRKNEVVMAKTSSQESGVDFGRVRLMVQAFGVLREMLVGSA